MLLLLPNLLSEEVQHHELFIPASVDRAIQKIDGLIAESERNGRRYLKRFLPETFRDIPIELLNKHTTDIEPLLKPEQTWGLISDCGLPCLADPGAQLVTLARKRGVKVRTFVGPSSVILGLQLSGLSGQAFTFHGYFHKDDSLSRIENDRFTHIFIEAPHKNIHFLENLLQSLSPETLLSVSWDLTLPTQNTLTHTIATWRKIALPNIYKKPAIFLFSAN